MVEWIHASKFASWNHLKQVRLAGPERSFKQYHYRILSVADLAGSVQAKAPACKGKIT
jgi:hypothetical protein